MVDAIEIRAMAPTDWPAAASIYGEGIATGDATFETEIPDWAHFDAGHLTGDRLVAVRGDEVLAWFALSPWSSRRVYRGVAWESVYVAERARGQGLGRQVLLSGALASEALGVWTLLAGVMAENAASLTVHAAAGFRRIGVQERVGQDATGRWRDVVLLERRSPVVGR